MLLDINGTRESERKRGREREREKEGEKGKEVWLLMSGALGKIQH